MTVPLLTLFTIPKPFQGTTAIQQRNAIQSWQLLGDRVEVIVVGDDSGVAEAARDLGVRHIPDVRRNEHGTPLVDSVFHLGTSASSSGLLCYANADIILMSDFLGAIGQLASHHFLMCGRRWDLDLDVQLDFTRSDWETNLRTHVRKAGALHAATGIDYFAFRRGLFDSMPSFAIGRTIWDNWMLFHARASGAPIVDATDAVMAVHQNHSYGHVPGGIEAVWRGAEAMRNQELAAEMLVPFTIDNANLRISSSGVAPNLSRAHLAKLPSERLALLLRARPRLRAAVRKVTRPVLAGRV
jgi:hypothetical protein